MAELMQTVEERIERANQFLVIKGFAISLQQGQRVANNLWHQASDQVEWNEIFVGKLPRDLFEDELLPILEKFGNVCKIRYMMDFSGFNRGFCFIKYATCEEALRACRYFNGAVLRPDKPPIVVKLSFDNKCLFFRNLPHNCTRSRLIQELNQMGAQGVVDAQVKPPYCEKIGNKIVKNRCAHVMFVNHDAATKARRLLLTREVKFLNRKLEIDWDKPDIPAEVLMSLGVL